MDRREWLNLLGAGGAGLAATGAACGADGHAAAKQDHGGGKPADKFLAPLGNTHAHFCGIHVAKNNPKFQLVAQHYCGPLDSAGDVHQCLLFESCEKAAKLLGVEYIITDALYQGLSAEEKAYWRDTWAAMLAVMAGGLIAPGMAAADEMKFMKFIINTWGKTWHTWPDPKTKVPVGPPLLMWSLGADDQVDPAVVAARDKQFNVDTAKVRDARIKELGFGVPNVAFPKDITAIGRQWTNTGDDKPTKKP
jgi:hypothetical protein